MWSNQTKKPCTKCVKGLGHILCGGCHQWMCMKHFNEHRQMLGNEIDYLSQKHDQLQQDLNKDLSHEHQMSLSIDQWEQQSIALIRQRADRARLDLREHLNERKQQVRTLLNQVSQEMRESRETEDYSEIELNRWLKQLEKLRRQLENQSTIEIVSDQGQHRNDGIDLIKWMVKPVKIHLDPLDADAKWSENGLRIHESDESLSPSSLDIDDDGTIFAADHLNHRIMAWKTNSTVGEVVAGGDGPGGRIDQLKYPTAVIIDRQTNSLIISDSENRRVVRWSRQAGSHGQVILSNIFSYGLALDRDNNLYVSDWDKHEVRRYKSGDRVGIVVAGGHGPGARLDQLNHPENIFVDEQSSVYVSDNVNHRVMKWMKNATKGILVNNSPTDGHLRNQIVNPTGLFVDRLGSVYILDSEHRFVTRWIEGSQCGTVAIRDDKWNHPSALAIDRDGNICIADMNNHQILRYNIE